MIFVIAANKQGFDYFCRQFGLDPHTTTFVHEFRQLLGLSHRLVLLAPGWWMGRGGSDFSKSCDAAGIYMPSDLRARFFNLKFLEVL